MSTYSCQPGTDRSQDASLYFCGVNEARARLLEQEGGCHLATQVYGIIVALTPAPRLLQLVECVAFYLMGLQRSGCCTYLYPLGKQIPFSSVQSPDFLFDGCITEEAQGTEADPCLYATVQAHAAVHGGHALPWYGPSHICLYSICVSRRCHVRKPGFCFCCHPAQLACPLLYSENRMPRIEPSIIAADLSVAAASAIGNV